MYQQRSSETLNNITTDNENYERRWLINVFSLSLVSTCVCVCVVRVFGKATQNRLKLRETLCNFIVCVCINDAKIHVTSLLYVYVYGVCYAKSYTRKKNFRLVWVYVCMCIKQMLWMSGRFWWRNFPFFPSFTYVLTYKYTSTTHHRFDWYRRKIEEHVHFYARCVCIYALIHPCIGSIIL